MQLELMFSGGPGKPPVYGPRSVVSCWCAVFYQWGLPQGWWHLSLGQGIGDFGDISTASIKTFPSLARLQSEATLLCICVPSRLWMGVGCPGHSSSGKNIIKRSSEQVRALPPQNVCSSGAQRIGPAWSQSHLPRGHRSSPVGVIHEPGPVDLLSGATISLCSCHPSWAGF